MTSFGHPDLHAAPGTRAGAYLRFACHSPSQKASPLPASTPRRLRSARFVCQSERRNGMMQVSSGPGNPAQPVPVLPLHRCAEGKGGVDPKAIADRAAATSRLRSIRLRTQSRSQGLEPSQGKGARHVHGGEQSGRSYPLSSADGDRRQRPPVRPRLCP